MKYVLIPQGFLSIEALHGVVKSHILREGTDYGLKEFAFTEKIQSVMNQLKYGHAVIVYDESEEVCHIIRKEEWEKMEKQIDLSPTLTYEKELR